MKMILRLCLLLSVYYSVNSVPTATSVPIEEGRINNFHNDFKEVLKLIPVDKITEIANDHLKNDERFRAAILYMQSAKWKDRWETILATPEWKDFKAYFDEIGFDVEQALKCIRNFVEKITVPKDLPTGAEMSIRKFLDEAEGAIPVMQIIGALYQNVTKNKQFEMILEKVSNKKLRDIMDKLFGVPEIKELVNDFETMGVPVKLIFTSIYAGFRWGDVKI